MPNYNSLQAAILAGGRSTRFNNIAKGNLIVAGETIIARQIKAIHSCSIEKIIINANDVNPYKQYNLPIIADENCKHQTPLTGIATILAASNPHGATLFLPCDLPNITKNEINQLITEFNSSNNPIIYAKSPISHHPLCCIIKNNLATTICSMLEQKFYKIMPNWNKLNAKALQFNDDKPFANINSQKDYVNLEYLLKI